MDSPDLASAAPVLTALHSRKLDCFLRPLPEPRPQDPAFALSLLTAAELLAQVSERLLAFGLFLVREKKPRFFRVKLRIALFLRQFVLLFDRLCAASARTPRAGPSAPRDCPHFPGLPPEARAASLRVADFRVCLLCVFRSPLPATLDRIRAAQEPPPPPGPGFEATFADPLELNQFLLRDSLGFAPPAPALSLLRLAPRLRSPFGPELVVRVARPPPRDGPAAEAARALGALRAGASEAFVEARFACVERSLEFLCLLGSSASSSRFLRAKVSDVFATLLRANPRLLFFARVAKLFSLKMRLSGGEGDVSAKGRFTRLSLRPGRAGALPGRAPLPGCRLARRRARVPPRGPR